jgi:hypothetical protein
VALEDLGDAFGDLVERAFARDLRVRAVRPALHRVQQPLRVPPLSRQLATLLTGEALIHRVVFVADHADRATVGDIDKD